MHLCVHVVCIFGPSAACILGTVVAAFNLHYVCMLYAHIVIFGVAMPTFIAAFRINVDPDSLVLLSFKAS